MHVPTVFQVKMSKNKEKVPLFLISPSICHRLTSSSVDMNAKPS
jgi:hypothetical protein